MVFVTSLAYPWLQQARATSCLLTYKTRIVRILSLIPVYKIINIKFYSFVIIGYIYTHDIFLIIKCEFGILNARFFQIRKF